MKDLLFIIVFEPIVMGGKHNTEFAGQRRRVHNERAWNKVCKFGVLLFIFRERPAFITRHHRNCQTMVVKLKIRCLRNQL